MDKKTAYAKNPGCLGGADGGVLKQGHAKPFSLKRLINGKTAKNGDRDRIGHIAADLARCIVQFQSARSKAVIADNLFFRQHNVGTESSAELIWVCPLLEPIIKTVNTTGKVIKPMIRSQ